MRSSFGLILAFAVASLALPVAAHADWYSDRGGRSPVGDRVYVCHGYSCRIVTPVQLSTGDISEIAAPLLRPLQDAGSEREAISRSVELFETVIGNRAGTANDRPAMQFGAAGDDQMDCIDETTNTTSLLLVLAARGYLQHHRVAEPASRGFFLDGRYPHATAVLAEAQSGTKWVVDSWPRANGQPPVIQPLSHWRRLRSSALPS